MAETFARLFGEDKWGLKSLGTPAHGYEPTREAAMAAFKKQRERESLAQVDRHIAECQAHIADQREITQQAIEQGEPADLPEGMLRALEESLAPVRLSSPTPQS